MTDNVAQLVSNFQHRRKKVYYCWNTSLNKPYRIE